MQAFRVHTGIVVPLDRANIDTDQIIPKQFLKRIERTGFGKFLFYDWRYRADGTPDESFALNAPMYAGASILVAGKNFGCGSSREHAPWALADYGFRAIIAPSFADIFANNCGKNGILTIRLSEGQVAELQARAKKTTGYELRINLEQCSVADAQDFSAHFVIDSFRRHCLLHGLDDIDLTLRHEDRIRAYELKHQLIKAAG